jgi:hypothetical protein
MWLRWGAADGAGDKMLDPFTQRHFSDQISPDLHLFCGFVFVDRKFLFFIEKKCLEILRAPELHMRQNPGEENFQPPAPSVIKSLSFVNISPNEILSG